MLKTFLEANGISQADVSRGLEWTEGFTSRLARGETGASLANVNRLLAWLSDRVGRRVTYEEAFGPDRDPGRVPA